MARRQADPVEVRGEGGPGGRPTHFLWRDRVYAVREVLGHWREGGAWWDAPAQAAPAPLDAAEREVWRVEASRGRCYAPGVYELSLDRAGRRWTLSRAAD
ncbi:DUF6504 family protein [Phaeacidiphilus oryzae]|uniref:DUF6504 family protein n=1 Tax=Phaeacidiphilus oryzae TaxID=348818 RepID=UPI00056AC522|nr:DUF6504 family protein [Phaeacidiphilus oryzae]